MPKIKNKWQVYMSRAEHGFIFYFHIVSGNLYSYHFGYRETQIILLIHSYPISYPLVPPLNSQCGWGPETSNLWTNPNSKFYLNCWSHHIPRYSYRVTPTCLLLCQAKSQFQENEIGIPTLFIFNFAFSPFFLIKQ